MSECNLNSVIANKIFSAKLFDVDEVTINLKNGKTVVHHVVERHPTVSILPITENYEIYLIDQYRYTLKKRAIETVAGFIEENETPLDAAKRELLEETGLKAAHWEQALATEIAGSVLHAQLYTFIARDITQEQAHPEEDEDIHVIKMPLETAVEKIFTGEINTSSSILAILVADKLRKEGKI